MVEKKLKMLPNNSKCVILFIKYGEALKNIRMKGAEQSRAVKLWRKRRKERGDILNHYVNGGNVLLLL